MRIEHGYKRGDVERLCEISDACFEGLERPPHADLKQMLSISEVWIARAVNPGFAGDVKTFEAGTIFGYIIVDRRLGAYLWQIAVDKKYQRRGIAGNLIRESEGFCKKNGDDSMRLHVHADNPSQRLYFDRGFRVYDIEPNYYGDGTKALMMKKAL